MLQNRLGKELLIFDGAMGTQLQNAGLSAGDIPEELNIDRPDLLRSIRKSNVVWRNRMRRSDQRRDNSYNKMYAI